MRKFLLLLMMTMIAGPGTVAAAGAKEQPVCDCCAKGAQGGAARATGAPDGHASCKYCGMDREKFAHSRMLIEYDDGTTVATCSVHCAAVDLANSINLTPKAIRVGDYATRELIDAEQAVWVIGGSKQGVMTRNPKWAFAGKGAAEAFVRENGGRLATFDEAMAAAYTDLYQDTRMVREKRKQRMKR